MSTYNRQEVMFERGEGAWIWDTSGRRYFDALCGIAVCSLGHAHPKVTEAICLQAGELLHTSNLYRIDLQEQLGERLTARSGLQNTFFCNSGAEANEVAEIRRCSRDLSHSYRDSSTFPMEMQQRSRR